MSHNEGMETTTAPTATIINDILTDIATANPGTECTDTGITYGEDELTVSALVANWGQLPGATPQDRVMAAFMAETHETAALWN